VALIEIADTKRTTFEAAIRKRVAPGALIWTDGHASYKWLGEASSGYLWDYVVHSTGEFSKDTETSFENGGPVSSNAVEGLFSRFKSHNRKTKQILNPKRSNYGLWVGEFLFIEKYLNAKRVGAYSWRAVAFFQLIRLLCAYAWSASSEPKREPPVFQCTEKDKKTFSSSLNAFFELEQVWVPKDFWTTPKFIQQSDESIHPPPDPDAAVRREQKKFSWGNALKKPLEDGHHVSIDLSDSDLEVEAKSDKESIDLNLPAPSNLSSGVSTAKADPEHISEFDAADYEEIFGAKEEDSIETDSATPPPAKRPRTRATAAARNAAWSVHATAAAHFVDASPRIPAPGSIAAECMEPGKVYRLIYNSGTTPGEEKVVKMSRWTNAKHLTGMFWEYKSSSPKTLSIKDMENIRLIPAGRHILD